VAANLLGFIRKNDDGVTPIGTALVDEEEDTGELISRSSPGQWVTLAPGEEPIAPQFGQDDQMFGEVLKTMLRRFSSGFGTNYSTNSRDYSDVNYTSIRMSLIEDRDWFKVIQSLLIQLFHQRVYEEWFKAAMLSGQLPTARFGNYWTDPDLFLTPRWQARTWVGADPSKDMEAYRDAQRLGLQSTADQIAESYGEDLEHVWAQIAYELALRKRLGLPVVLDGVYETVSNTEQPPGSSEQLTT
jgi:capsid protein